MVLTPSAPKERVKWSASFVRSCFSIWPTRCLVTPKDLAQRCSSPRSSLMTRPRRMAAWLGFRPSTKDERASRMASLFWVRSIATSWRRAPSGMTEPMVAPSESPRGLSMLTPREDIVRRQALTSSTSRSR